jgi:O-antigen/teichoic acid export membrane protein
MKAKFTSFLNHPLVSGSSVLFFGTLFANIFNLLFTLFMTANLSVRDYGIVASLISMISLTAYGANALIPTIVQFAGKYFANQDLGSIRSLYEKIGLFLISVAIMIFLTLIIFIKPLGAFFNISDPSLFVITDLTILLGFLIVLNNAMLQAKIAFHAISIISIIGTSSKLIFAILFIYVGLGTKGAALALLIAALLPFLFSFLPLKEIFKKNIHKQAINLKEIIGYSVPSVLGTLALTSFVTVDIIWVKHFFNEYNAGLYAGLSTVARIIFFFTSPIGMAMFPLIVRKHNKGERYTSTLLIALGIVFFSSLSLTILYYLYPNFVVLHVLRRKEYLAVTPQLALFALSITIYSVLTLMVYFYFSIRITKIFFPLLVGAFLQVILLTFFHDSLSQIITITLSIELLLLVGLLLYYPYATKKK